MAMANGARTLAEAYPGRFILGIGVSHAPSVLRRGGTYDRPIERMTAYLDAMETAAYAGPLPEEPIPVILAALGPRMLELAATRTDGAHSYFVPVEHTAMARKRLGDGALLAVEQTAVLDTDRARSRGPSPPGTLPSPTTPITSVGSGGRTRMSRAAEVNGWSTR